MRESFGSRADVEAENPCRSCATANVSCVYPLRDRNIVVSEAYLEGLHAHFRPQQSLVRHDSVSTAQSHVQAPTYSDEHRRGRRALLLSASTHQSTVEPVLTDSTAESFVSGLVGLSNHHNKDPTAVPNPDNSQKPATARNTNRAFYHEYVPLGFDSSAPKAQIKLPPYLYAVQLIQQFESYVGYEYHWYHQPAFQAAVEATYKGTDTSHTSDRVWLCKLLTVLALGESYNAFDAPQIRVGEQDVPQSILGMPQQSESTLPGAAFFSMTLHLFKVPSEESTVAHVEVCNLMVRSELLDVIV
jgi:proline utilization trans-activator